MRGLAHIPSKNYLLSHNGCNSTPSPKTVHDILKWSECEKLYFLYVRKREKDSKYCGIEHDCVHCEDGSDKKTWKCCIKQDGKHIGKEWNKKIDTNLHSNGKGKFKFFPFQVLPH